MADHVVYTGFDPAFGDRLDQLISRAKAEGYSPNLISGVRSAYGWPGMKGQSQADLYSQLGKPGGPRAAAAPGYSPHQYGLAGDVTGIPQSELERLAPGVGLQAIHGDPNHVELANWQQAAATQPSNTPWDQTNPENVPSKYASNISAGNQPAGGGFAVPPGGRMSPEQIYQLAIKHGFAPGQEATTATAVAMGESSGKIDAFNSKDSHGGSIGLMQINGANAGLIGGENWKTAGTDPDASMAAAHALFERKGGFGDWGAYTDGSYKQYLNQATAAASAPGVTLTSVPPGPMDPSAQAHGSTVNPAIPDAAASELNPLQKFFTRPPSTKDAQGNDVQGKSQAEKIADLLPSGKQGGQQQQAATSQPAQFAPAQDPTAQLAGPAAQLYNTVQATAAKPLSWNSRPYGWNAGLQQIPGMTLNSAGYG